MRYVETMLRLVAGAALLGAMALAGCGDKAGSGQGDCEACSDCLSGGSKSGDAATGGDASTQGASGSTGGAGLAALKLKLPKPLFKETPKDAPKGLKIEKNRQGPPPMPLVPDGAVNLAAGKPVTASDEYPVIGEAELITDGDKEATEGSYVEFSLGKQWVQIDLGAVHPIYAITVWHYHGQARVYHDVVIQVAEDKDFLDPVTIFNNDDDNSSGLGIGTSLGYWEQHFGKTVWLPESDEQPLKAKPVKGRYVRLYSNGSTASEYNHYTEVEVWGLKQ